MGLDPKARVTNNVSDPVDIASTGCDLEAGVDIGDSEFGVTGDCENSSISVASDCGTTA